MAFFRNDNNEENEKSGSFFSRIFRRGDGPGVDPDEPPITDNPNFVNFFKLYLRKFNNIVLSNLLFVFGNFPIIFLLLGLSGFFSGHTTAPTYTVFPNLSVIVSHKLTPASAALYGTYSMQTQVTVLSVTDYVMFALSLLTVFTLGPVMTGVTYIHRNLVRGEHVFIWGDFFAAVKKNFRQAMIYGVIDFIIIAILSYDLFFFRMNTGGSFFTSVLFFAILFLVIIYFFIRTYIYTMIVTFDLKMIKLFKNGLIMSVVGVKRNLAYLLGAAAVILLNYGILVLYFPLGIILPFTITISTLIFIGEYCVFPNIKRFMIDPYYESLENDAGETNEENEE